jgi:DNA adenine methylase/adenine-specific DNA-methyltransferase
MNEKYILSPLNFTGGKHKLLSQILPLFPDEIKTFFDIFCGGCNVGANVHAEKIICNDIDKKIIGLMNFFKQSNFNDLAKSVSDAIISYNLSDTKIHKYDFYGCSSANGLGSYNKNGFLKLRNDFNSMSENSPEYFLYLYVLIIFSFNNQIRFNQNGQFNLPVGKRDFNKKMYDKLKNFLPVSRKINFTNYSFDFFDARNFDKKDFVYADPPYLITCATYNEKNAWNEKMEFKLLNYLDSLNAHEIKFALSNVLSSNGKTNFILQNWIREKKYNCHHLDFSYRNSNYHKKQISNSTDEILITNY